MKLNLYILYRIYNYLVYRKANRVNELHLHCWQLILFVPVHYVLMGDIKLINVYTYINIKTCHTREQVALKYII